MPGCCKGERTEKPLPSPRTVLKRIFSDKRYPSMQLVDEIQKRTEGIELDMCFIPISTCDRCIYRDNQNE